MKKLLLSIYFLIVLSGVVYSATDDIPIGDGVVLERNDFSDLYNWEKENYREAIDAFLQNCERIMKLPQEYQLFPQVNKKINSGDFYGVCKIAEIIRNYNEKYLQVFFESYFVPFRVVNKRKESSVFTGYYIPIIKAKRKKDKIFKYPIYKRPSDLIDGVKYYTREEINNGILADRDLEIFYTDDPIELFFFHIQGSGNIDLIDENKVIAIGYDGKNNHNYTSIGSYMKKNSLLINSSKDAKKVKEELKKNPRLAKKILNINKSYIFFRILENNEFTGAFGSKLIPFRTMAVDKKYVPLGFPIWLNTTHVKKDKREDFSKLVIANDTGSAINGAVRGDIFFGFGDEGEEESSYQYASGKYYILIPIKILKKMNIKF